MQLLKTVAGVRSLKGFIAAASSACLLDLHGLAAEEPDDPDYVALPMFLHPVLNRTIIVKHNVRSPEEDELAPRRLGATKIIFPFDTADLNLGGQSMFVGQTDFIGALTRHLDYRGLPLDRDLAVLGMLDKLPTLDPFLVREMLLQQRIDVGRCYYRFSEVDRVEMLGFVAREIAALLHLCFGDMGEQDTRSQRLSQLLLADQDSPELDLLRRSLRMTPAAFSEAMFTWKGFLYYRWRCQDLTPQVRATLRALSRIMPRQMDRDAILFMTSAQRLLERTIARWLKEVVQRLGRYDRAFGSLTQGDADQFRQFLLQGSSLFPDLGQRVGRLEQVVSFWKGRFGPERIGVMSPEEVLDGMRDLLQGLAIRTAPRAQAA